MTAICSGPNRDLVTHLGADRVIDYTTEDVLAEISTYDMIVDCVGDAPYERVQHLLRPGGALLLVIADLPAILRAPVRRRLTGHRITADVGEPTADDLEFLVDLAEAGGYRAVRDRTVDLDDIAEAHRYVDTGHKRGSVVLRITSSPEPAASSIEHHSREAAS